MGIVVNNNIILIDSYRKELSKNDNNIYDAILIACKNRIRPIFLTTIPMQATIPSPENTILNFNPSNRVPSKIPPIDRITENKIIKV